MPFAFFVGGVLITVYVVRIGGDYIHARLLLPPLFAVCVPTAVIPLPRRVVSIGAVIVMVVWCVVSAFALRPAQEYRVTLDDRRNLVDVEDVIEKPVSQVTSLYRRGRIFWEGKRLPYAANPAVPRPTAAMQFIGTTGFILGPRYDMFDTLGLTDALTARFATGSRVSIPGHEKPIPAAWAAGAAHRARRATRGGQLRRGGVRLPDRTADPADDRDDLRPPGRRSSPRPAVRRPQGVPRSLHEAADAGTVPRQPLGKHLGLDAQHPGGSTLGGAQVLRSTLTAVGRRPKGLPDIRPVACWPWDRRLHRLSRMPHRSRMPPPMSRRRPT